MRVLVLAEIACASLSPRPTAVIRGLGMRVLVRMRTYENGVLCNGQQLWCAGRACCGFSLTYKDAKCSWTCTLR